MTQLLEHQYGPGSSNRIDETRASGIAGALAALETFYYALNHGDLPALAAVWSADKYAQLNNPVGGMLRSGSLIAELYGRIFASGMDVQVTFGDAVVYDFGSSVVFAGREDGSYRAAEGCRCDLHIRTSRVFSWDDEQGRWLQMHHHGSIDNPAALERYQLAAGRRPLAQSGQQSTPWRTPHLSRGT